MKFLLALFISLNVLALDDFNMAYFGEDEIIVKREEVIVKMVTYENEEEINKVYQELSGLDKSSVRSFAQVSPDSTVCYIHYVPAKIWDDRENLAIIGHELYHCLLAEHNNTSSFSYKEGEEEPSATGYNDD